MIVEFENEVAKLIIESLNLDIDSGDIEPHAPLFNEGLGLDSIDALELSMAVSKKYGVKIIQGDKKNAEVFSSLRALSNYIVENRRI